MNKLNSKGNKRGIFKRTKEITDKWKKTMSNNLKNKEFKNKLSKNFGDCKGKNNGMYGKKQSNNSKIKNSNKIKKLWKKNNYSEY
jgi:hypothetical protein